MTTPIAYLELPTNDVARSKEFYGSLFGWSFVDYGPDYAAFSDSGLEGGFNGGGDHVPRAPLAVLQTGDLEGLYKRVKAAGAAITMPIFAYPGGRRFQFTDPSGNELGAMQPD